MCGGRCGCVVGGSGIHCGEAPFPTVNHKVVIFTNNTTRRNSMTPQSINFITGNRNKLVEVEAILGPTVDLHSVSLDLVEIQGTIEEISLDKCRRAAAAVRRFGGELSA